ncbi:hypothetical protein KEM56_006571 [Ascosphaera pollenicola]|nr:hypothetical protein KEM56_006571 [Ascosphaera pollenicola]
MASVIDSIINSAAEGLNALATVIIRLAPRVLDYAIPAVVTLTNYWLSYLSMPTNTITYIGALVNSLITLVSNYMRTAVNRIVDLSTGILTRVISWVKSIMSPLANRKPGPSEQAPVPQVPERPKKDGSKNNHPSQEDPIEIKPVI